MSTEEPIYITEAEAVELLRPAIPFLTRRVKELRAEGDYDDSDYLARQLVDDAWREGIDIQFAQHLVERAICEEVL